MAFCINLCGNDLYALAISSHAACRYFFSFQASWIALHIMVARSQHPGYPGSPAFVNDVYIYNRFPGPTLSSALPTQWRISCTQHQQRYWPELWQGCRFCLFRDMDSIHHTPTQTDHHFLPCHPKKSPKDLQNWWALLKKLVGETVDPRCALVSAFLKFRFFYPHTPAHLYPPSNSCPI